MEDVRQLAGRAAQLERTVLELERSLRERATELALERAGRQQLEAALIRATKLEHVGRLTAGLAHDLNNLLTVALAQADLVALGTSGDEELRVDIEELRDAVTRASRLTSQILSVARQEVRTQRALDINGVIRDLEVLLRRLLGPGVDLAIEPAEFLWLVRADPVQLEQVFVNLAANARDAMPRGGTFAVRTQNVDLNADDLRRDGDPPAGSFVEIAVSDTGDGMTEEVKAHLFEPFFTTKKHGKGTGLGLASALGIVRRHGGVMRVESEFGIGSTFRIYLPRAVDGARDQMRLLTEPRWPSGRSA